LVDSKGLFEVWGTFTGENAVALVRGGLVLPSVMKPDNTIGKQVTLPFYCQEGELRAPVRIPDHNQSKNPR
jgi:hypothetical protein